MLRVILLQVLLFLQFILPVLADGLSDLELRGAGALRYLGIFKVYDASLYTDDVSKNKNVLAADCSRCLELIYAMDLSAEDIIEASDAILKKQHDKMTLEGVQTELTLLYRSYEDVQEGDIYTLCYDANTQNTTVLLNNKLILRVPSPEFAAIYFGIWLLDHDAIDDHLRQKLLSGG